MTSYVLRRLLLAIPVLIGIMTAVFVMLHAIPGDPALAMAGEPFFVKRPLVWRGWRGSRTVGRGRPTCGG